MNKIKVGIIDTGVEKKIFDNVHLKCYKLYIDENNYINLEINNSDMNGHGTLVLSSILSEVNDTSMLEFYSINITDTQESSIELLVEAIKLMLKFDVKILNISMALEYNMKDERLNELLNLINYSKNKIAILCSEYNGKKDTFPASFNNVIGINTYFGGSKSEFYVNNIYEKNILVNSRSKLLKNNKGAYEFFGDSTSFATSTATGIVLNELVENNEEYDMSEEVLEYIFEIILASKNRIEYNLILQNDRYFNSCEYTEEKKVYYSCMIKSYPYFDRLLIINQKFDLDYVLDFFIFLYNKYNIMINKNNIRLFDFYSMNTLMNFIHRNTRI